MNAAMLVAGLLVCVPLLSEAAAPVLVQPNPVILPSEPPPAAVVATPPPVAKETAKASKGAAKAGKKAVAKAKKRR